MLIAQTREITFGQIAEATVGSHDGLLLFSVAATLRDEALGQDRSTGLLLRPGGNVRPWLSCARLARGWA